MQVGKEEDGHELFINMIPRMAKVSMNAAGGERRLSDNSKATTFVDHVFGGYSCDSIVCTICNKTSKRYASWSDFPLELRPSMHKLEQCLDDHFKKECMYGDNMYICSHCEVFVVGIRQRRIEVAPNFLVICLKRFRRLNDGRWLKNQQPVEYPVRLFVDK